MKIFTTIAAFAVLAGTGQAQMSPLPPSSSTDGVLTQSIGLNAGATHWDSTSSIGSFKIDSTSEGNAPITTVAFNPIGLPFSTAMPSLVQMNLNTLNANGGIVRTIFLSGSALWQDSLGYTRSGDFAGPQSFTAFANIQSNPASSIPVNMQFGRYFDVSMPIGAAADFDLWYQGEGGANGGDYTLFHPSNSSPSISPGNVLWGQRSVVANTWIPSLAGYADVATYVIGLEDWRLDRGSDRDYSDTVIALQFFTLTGSPFAPVPEPSTYGLLGAAALLGLVAFRRLKHKSPQAAAPAASLCL